MSEREPSEINLDSIKFRYRSHSRDLEHPAGRRKFALWAKSSGIALEEIESESDDVSVVTTGQN